MGGIGIFMSSSNDSVDQRAVGFKVAPRNAAMQIALRNTSAFGHPLLDFSWNHLITACQLGMKSIHEVEGCSRTQVAPSAQAKRASTDDREANTVPRWT